MVPRDNKQAAHKWVVSGVAAAIDLVAYLITGGTHASLKNQCTDRINAIANGLDHVKAKLASVQSHITSKQTAEIGGALEGLARSVRTEELEDPVGTRDLASHIED